VVNNALVKKVICSVVAECQFCVTIADPLDADIPLIAVSKTFEAMTGYKRSEILGVNCRFLNRGCPISPRDLMGLRTACADGSAFTALLPNRKKSGEMFVNLLDLRGLAVARHPETDERLWFLVGIQADVTGLAEHCIPEDHLRELRQLAALIRRRLRRELSLLAAGGDERLERQLTASSASSRERRREWRLLEEPVWTGGGQGPSSARAGPRRERAHAGVLLMSVLAFFAGLLVGRSTRRAESA